MKGKIDNFIPTVEFQLYGFHKDFTKTLIGIVDTGFNGFLKVPFVEAFPAGLILQGTETSTIANGSQTTDLVCLGTVIMFDKSIPTLISVAPNCPILIGTQLIKLLGLDVHFDFHNNILNFTESKKPGSIVPKPQNKASTKA